ncbi:MAG: response regulator transcription factor [Firmicutes bacterium]|nr:response regulator transcription factor [Bacillota bacterium]
MPTRVLLADDHVIVRQGLAAILKDDDRFEVVAEADDGEQAVRLAKQLHPDVVVMDIRMPNKNGLEATKEIHEALPDCHVVILSMYDDQEYVRAALAAGASGYLVKNTAASHLLAAIEEVQNGLSYLDPMAAKRVIESYTHPSVGGTRSREVDLLTSREREILVLIAQGLTNAEIADRLTISIKTVQTHITNIMTKLNLHNRVDLTRYALQNGIAE